MGKRKQLTILAICSVVLLAGFGSLFKQNASADPIGVWSVNGSSMYYTSGNLGIGTTLPSYKTEVNADGNVLRLSNSSNRGLEFRREAGTSGSWVIGTGDNFLFQVDGGTRLKVDKDICIGKCF